MHILEYFTKNGGDPRFIIEEEIGKTDLLNIAAENGSLDVIAYLLDNNIFAINKGVSEDIKTVFDLAVESNKIETFKYLLKRGTKINAKFNDEMIEFALYNIVKYIEEDYREMAKFLVKHGAQIPDSTSALGNTLGNIICPEHRIERDPTVGDIKDFLLSIGKLEDLYSTGQGDDFINAYKALDTETQEIWNIRQSRENLKKIANFIEEKFSKETVAIEYKEYDHLRKYNSLPKYKKDALEIFLINEKFTFNELITRADNFVNNNFFKLARIADSLEGSDFELLGETIMPHITQYLKFEDSSVKIAGSNIDHH
ncbi:MAG: ankyrin repeat domain-containing protein [Rickettsia endosymbiont of Graphium doson]|nr:ankyrin repeat domain-containing protein [Rickettsia endosymbiont of Graphium doson]